jgi:hypothetical protein
LELALNGKDVVRCLCWAPDGNSFYALEGKDGVVLRVAVDKFEILASLETGFVCSWLSLSSAGVVATMSDRQEVWILDPTTLVRQRKLDVPSVALTVSSPVTSKGFALAAGPDRGSAEIYVLDLPTGKVVRAYRPADFDKSLHSISTRMMNMTPDGKFLFTLGGIEQLQRYRIEEDQLHWEEASERIAQNGQAIEVSPASDFVCLPSGGGNYSNSANHPANVGPYATFIYEVTNIKKPAFVLRQGAYPKAVAFDPHHGRVFSQNHDSQLIVFSDTGLRQKEFSLGIGDTRQILPHPERNALLLLTDKGLYWINFEDPPTDATTKEAKAEKHNP